MLCIDAGDDSFAEAENRGMIGHFGEFTYVRVGDIQIPSYDKVNGTST